MSTPVQNPWHHHEFMVEDTGEIVTLSHLHEIGEPGHVHGVSGLGPAYVKATLEI